MRSACERGCGVSWRCVWMVRGRSWRRVVHLHADGEELAEPRVEPLPERDVEARLDEVAARALVREVARLDVVVLVPLRQQRHPQLVERPVAQRLDRVADRRVALVDPRVRRRADREVRAAVGVHERAAVAVHAHRARAGRRRGGDAQAAAPVGERRPVGARLVPPHARPRRHEPHAEGSAAVVEAAHLDGLGRAAVEREDGEELDVERVVGQGRRVVEELELVQVPLGGGGQRGVAWSGWHRVDGRRLFRRRSWYTP